MSIVGRMAAKADDISDLKIVIAGAKSIRFHDLAANALSVLHEDFVENFLTILHSLETQLGQPVVGIDATHLNLQVTVER